MLNLIVAVTENNVIGKDNDLLFKISEDLKRFKQLTTNNIVVMGRKTFESIGSQELPNRQNIVITNNPERYNHLKIDIELDMEDVDVLNFLIQKKKDEIKKIESSFIWLWINAKTDEEKNKVVEMFVKQTS